MNWERTKHPNNRTLKDDQRAEVEHGIYRVHPSRARGRTGYTAKYLQLIPTIGDWHPLFDPPKPTFTEAVAECENHHKQHVARP